MRKLKLDELEVESFPVVEETAGRGTVRGNQQSNSNWDCFSCNADTCSGGMLCQCATKELSYCFQCLTDEISHCQAC